MVVRHTLAVRCISLSCIKPMVVRCIANTESNILAIVKYQSILMCQACITSELCYCVKENKCAQGGVYLLYILIDHDNTLAGRGKFTCNASTIPNEVADYMKT